MEVTMQPVEERSQPVSVNDAPSGRKFAQIITHPVVDRVIAIVAILPFVYTMYLRFTQRALNLTRISTILVSLLMIGTMVFRRAPVRVTPNPWFWLLAFVATYGTLALPLFAQRGIALVPNSVSNAIALLSLGITAYARISLGRNIGFVPAQRDIVTTGAYRYVRHPIYTGGFVALTGFVLRSYSPANMGMVVVITTLFLIKSVVEENFLKSGPSYAAYLCQVRFRWIPGIV
jgi:protein-S-isoprenylcysteine O-methyltransferase Ste14